MPRVDPDQVVQAFKEAASNMKSGAARMTAAGFAPEDFAHFASHMLPDDQVEAMRATCRSCGAPTVGTWQHAPGGRRVRTPNEHSAPPGVAVCPGSFEAALLTTPGKE